MTRFDWEPLFPIGWIIAGGLVALTALLWLEQKRKSKYKRLRILAHILMVSSLVFLILDLKIQLPTQSKGLILLTANYQSTSLDSLLKVYENLEVIRTDDAAAHLGAPSQAEEEIISKSGRIRFILGDGPPPYLTKDFKSDHYTFIGSLPRDGIVSMDHPHKYHEQRLNKIFGMYRQVNSGIVNLKFLNASDIAEDSLQLKGKGLIPFSFTFFPKINGQTVWRVVTSDSSNTVIDSSELYLDILPEEKLSIAILSGYPTFELRYLKNHLANQGHQLSIRNKISKGKFQFEFVNKSKFNFGSITQKVLDSFDLIFIDGPTLTGLSSGEFRLLHDAIAQGLGVIVISPAQKMPTGNSKTLLNYQVEKAQELDTAKFVVEKQGEFRLPFVSINVLDTHIPILTSKDHQILAGYTLYGAGKVGFQTLNETYRIGLEGNGDAYSLIWASLVEAVARQQLVSNDFKLISPFPWYANEPIEFQITSANSEINPTVKLNGDVIPLMENHLVDNVWYGTFWLDNGDWQKINIDSSHFNIHPSEDFDWNTMRVHNQWSKAQIESKLYSSSLFYNSSTMSLKSARLLFFLLFALASGFLWLSPKL